MSRRRIPLQVLLAACAVAVLLLIFPERSIEQRLAKARSLIEQHQSARAAEIAAEVLRSNPDHSEALIVAGMAAGEIGNHEDSVAFYRRIAVETDEVWIEARVREAEICLNRIMDIDRTADVCRQLLEVAPDNAFGLGQLAFIYSLQTRVHELVPLQLRLLRSGVVSPEIVMSLIQGDLLYPDEETIALLQPPGNSHAGMLMARARIASFRNESDVAKQLLSKAAQLRPEMPEVQARLGKLLLAQGTPDEMESWLKRLPDSALEHPETWQTLGKWFARIGEWRSAARCYWEAGMKDAAAVSTNYGLGHALALLDRTDEAQPFLDRAVALEHYRKTFEQGRLRGDTEDQPLHLRLQAASQEVASLGLLWEAYAFLKLASETPAADFEVHETLEEILQILPSLSLTRTTPEKNPFHQLDLSDLPMPDFRIPLTQRRARDTELDESNAVSFSDVADQVGLRFQFNKGTHESFSGAVRPYDFTGGGIAVVDFDADSWPDIFCTQGGDVLLGGDPSSAVDQMFRNTRGQKFENVSAQGIPPDANFGQGVSAADVNADGFPDLLIANLGRNRLLKNNGDGTFTDITAVVDNDANRWTTSCLICDINKDGISDLYSVNYLSGDVIDRICRDETGRVASCAPQDFPASQDQLHLGTDSGLFHDASEAVGVQRPNGKGLGILAADVDGNGELELLVANDGVPNFCFEKIAGTDYFQLTDGAMVRGLGVNHDGNSEAGMGIAAEDFNADGKLDFVVTNFMDETNTLYLGSQATGYFEDRTQQFGLDTHSRKRLGFGIQPIDGDLDGHSDLIVAYGHVDDFRDRGVPWQMQAAYYQNLAGSGFQPISHETVGTYFRRKTLGRSIATLDWNRDGAEEAVIGHLTSRYALLHNATAKRGHYLKVHLKPEKTGCETTGTVVTVKSDHITVRRQLVSGGGYQATNERMLVFGLGKATSVRDITVSWPDGGVDLLTGIPIDAEIVIRQNHDRAWEVPR